MTNYTEVSKFNKEQRAVLRAMFGGRDISYLDFNQTTDFVIVQFGGVVQHSFYLGPRGGVTHHKVCQV